MSQPFAHLLSPIRIGNVEIRNRIATSAHGTAIPTDRKPNSRLAVYHAERAKGGVGLVIFENSRVHPTGRGGLIALEGWHEENVPLYREVADAVHAHGAKIFAQLHHPGRNANSQDTLLPVWAPSSVPIPFANPSGSNELPKEMSQGEIAELLTWWARCARNLKAAGMDGVEIHGAHGFLICQFLSEVTNKRTDAYGGSLRNRARFVLEVVDAVRQAVGADFVVGVRLSADELIPGGLQPSDIVQVSQWLEDTGQIDFLHISHSVEYAPLSLSQQVADMSWPQGAFVHLADTVKKALRKTPVLTVCRIVDPHLAERIVKEHQADMVCMTRAHLADPEIGRKLWERRPDDIRPCIGCNQGCCGRALGVGKPIGCAVNPEAGREEELGPVVRAGRSRRIVVVGGGPAGMEAARVAAIRGHRVTLFEAGQRLGGQVNVLVRAPHRQEFGNATAWLERQIRQLGVEVELGIAATPESIPADAEAIVVAVGSEPAARPLPGASAADAPPVADVAAVLQREVDIRPGMRVLVVDEDGSYRAGGTSELLLDLGAEVHHVTGAGTLGKTLHMVIQTPLLFRLREKGIRIWTDREVDFVRGRTVALRHVYGGAAEVIAGVDLLVVAAPHRPRSDLAAALISRRDSRGVHAVGDCVTARSFLEAVREGHMAARAL